MSVKAGRVRTTMREECEELLHFVREAHAQEQRGSQGISLDDARIAACIHLRRAAQRAVLMDCEKSNWTPVVRTRAVN